LTRAQPPLGALALVGRLAVEGAPSGAPARRERRPGRRGWRPGPCCQDAGGPSLVLLSGVQRSRESVWDGHAGVLRRSCPAPAQAPRALAAADVDRV